MNRNAYYNKNRTEYIVWIVTAGAICMLLKHVSTAFSENNKRFKETGAKFKQLMENARGTY